MKGIVFKELIGMVEEVFGDEMADKIIEKSDLESEGAYTSVGTYDHSEILQLVTHLSQETGVEAGKLVKTFGKHMATVFSKAHSDFFKQPDAFSFLKSVDGYIHVEVKKLYPEAELPKFEFEELSSNELIMKYSSKRPFAALAEGLIEGVIEHYNESISLRSEDQSGGVGNACHFYLEKAS